MTNIHLKSSDVTSSYVESARDDVSEVYNRVFSILVLPNQELNVNIL